MTYMRCCAFIMCLFALCARADAAGAADMWVAATDPAVVTNNDCGQIASVTGRPMIHRSFQAQEAEGTAVNIADRISSGDELIVPPGSLVEWTAGANTVAVLGPGGRVRFDGARVFAAADGREAVRLDVTVISGELRAQARENENRPEMIRAALNGAEFLLTRGDAAFVSGELWQAAVLSGEASGRLRRGAMPGAAFALEAGTMVDAAGQAAIGEDGMNAVKQRVPFSFETARAALPPLPLMSAEMDAP